MYLPVVVWCLATTFNFEYVFYSCHCYFLVHVRADGAQDFKPAVLPVRTNMAKMGDILLASLFFFG